MSIAETLRWRKEGFDIVECPRCGLLFRAKLPGDEELEAIYGLAYFARPEHDDGQGYADYLGDGDVHRTVARLRLDRMVRHGGSGPLLDVGCAGGYFLDEARRRSWRVEGIDVSEAMAGFAREELGLPVTTGRFDELEPQTAPYGAITMWDYIEHSLDPVADLTRARSLIDDDGVLALSTGDAGTLVARLSGSRWHLLTPRHHMYFFTLTTLRLALDRAGFEIVWAGHPGARYTLSYLVHKIRTLAPRSRLLSRLDRRMESWRLGSVTVPVNLGDIVTVIARPVPRPALV